MFGLYDIYKTALSQYKDFIPVTPVAACLSGCTEAVLSPLERVQVIMNSPTYNTRFQNTYKALSYIVSEHGFKELYRGTSLILLRNGPQNALFFTTREWLEYTFIQDRDEVKGFRLVFYDFILGAGLGGCISSVFFPINVVKNMYQSEIGQGSIRDTLTRIRKERGSLRLLYR